MAGSKRLFFLASLAVTLLIAGIPAAESATLDLMGYGWNKAEVAVVIKAGGKVADAAIGDVIAAIEDWNMVLEETGGPLLTLMPDTRTRDADIIIQLKAEGGPVIGYTRLKATKGYSCVLEKASIHISGSPIFGSKLTDVGIRNVARHEIGHALGLGHSDDSADVMYPTMTSTEIWGGQDKAITENDAAAIDAIYPLPDFCELPGSVKTDRSNLTVLDADSE